MSILATTPPLNGSAALQLARADAQWALRGWRDLLASHQREWQRFWTQASFLSLSHPRLVSHTIIAVVWVAFFEECQQCSQSSRSASNDRAEQEQFYWITQYKLGSGMGLRGDLAGVGGVMDHTSPWYLPNNGLLNWDLNIEMTCMGRTIIARIRAALADSLSGSLGDRVVCGRRQPRLPCGATAPLHRVRCG